MYAPLKKRRKEGSKTNSSSSFTPVCVERIISISSQAILSMFLGFQGDPILTSNRPYLERFFDPSTG
jgi:hypothetical protein